MPRLLPLLFPNRARNHFTFTLRVITGFRVTLRQKKRNCFTPRSILRSKVKDGLRRNIRTTHRGTYGTRRTARVRRILAHSSQRSHHQSGRRRARARMHIMLSAPCARCDVRRAVMLRYLFFFLPLTAHHDELPRNFAHGPIWPNPPRQRLAELSTSSRSPSRRDSGAVAQRPGDGGHRLQNLR